jgi:hypothetical protein
VRGVEDQCPIEHLAAYAADPAAAGAENSVRAGHAACWVLVEYAAESVSSANVELVELAWFG